MAVLGTLVGVGQADAASWRSWRALVGNGWPTQDAGANGVATIDLYWNGAGSLSLDLKNLVRNTSYSVTLFKGPYIYPGSSWSSRAGICADLSDGTVVRLAAVKTTAAGTIVRAIDLSASQMKAINAIPRRIAVTVGSGRYARCGGFQLLTRPAGSTAPSPSPSPTVDPGPARPAICAPWPPEVADILAVLTVPDGLCLVRYPSRAEAPAFMEGLDGGYFPGLRTIFYVAEVATRETEVLAHEVCHAHQDRVTHDAFGTELGEDWHQTLEGLDYLRATGWRLEGERWIYQPDATAKRLDGVSSSTSPVEDNAGTCALWFDPALGPHFLRRWAPARFAWAQRWLPLPTFIVPWQAPPE